MATELIINATLPETRIALMENGEIQEVLIERAHEKGIVGNIYKGRVTRVLPGMQAAFVDIGLEKAAFLYVDDVYTRPEVWEIQEEGEGSSDDGDSGDTGDSGEVSADSLEGSTTEASAATAEGQTNPEGSSDVPSAAPTSDAESELAALRRQAHEQLDTYDLNDDEEEEEEDREGSDESDDSDDEEDEEDFDEEADDQDEEDEGKEERMAADGSGDDFSGTVPPPAGGGDSGSSSSGGGGSDSGAGADGSGASAGAGGGSGGEFGGRRRHRRGRRGGRNRKRNRDGGGRDGQSAQGAPGSVTGQAGPGEEYPDSYQDQIQEGGDDFESDRTALSGIQEGQQGGGEASDRPSTSQEGRQALAGNTPEGAPAKGTRPEFREQRGRDRKIRSKQSMRPPRGQVNIQDLLKEGQEVIVQVAKDPISSKGARLTCHISLPGRHLVCMPTIDHVGVSRRIERDDDRRRLRDFVEKNRPKNLGFIVRTASGKQSERRVKQDIEYLTRLWGEIREKASTAQAPALVYEDLNSILRAIRDWVTEDIDRILVDSRYHFNDIQKFVSHFMPSIRQKIELHQSETPIFDAMGISTELARSLERKVWLKSGGYIVIDQAEALVAIDVNTGRFVGKKNLEDTILKTNLEAVAEIAYQLRLRNCGGIIILDLIDMEKEENKHRVYRALEEALKKDRSRPSILKISELGLVEMTRKRTRDTIIRTMCESCAHCEGKGYIKTKQTVAYEVMRQLERDGADRDVTKILVRAHADVIDVLAMEARESLDNLERRYRKPIYLQAVEEYHPEQVDVVSERRDRSEKTYTTKRQEERQERQERNRGRGDRGGRGGGRDRNRDDRGDREAQGGNGGGEGRDENRTEGRSDNRNEGRHEGRNRDRNRDRGGRDRNRDQPTPNGVTIGRPRVQIQPQAQNPSAEPGNAGDAQPSQLVSPGSDYEPGNTGPRPTHSHNADDDVGNRESLGNEQRVRPENGLDQPSSGSVSHFESEEDRIAYQRAQAAQDAAIARLDANGNRVGNGNDRGGLGRGDRGGRNNRGGRGGRDRDRGRGGRGGGSGRDRNRGGGQGFSGPRQPRDPGQAPISAVSSASSGGEGNGGGNAGGES